MAAKKKSAIEARQGHPAGFIDDAAEIIGKAMKKTRSAGEFVSDVGSDRYARMRYSTIPKAKKKVYRKVEDVALNRQARKQITRKMAPSKDDRAFYRAERKEEIRMDGPLLYTMPRGSKKVLKKIDKAVKKAKKNTKPPSEFAKMNRGK
jgi:hypothetical protein